MHHCIIPSFVRSKRTWVCEAYPVELWDVFSFLKSHAVRCNLILSRGAMVPTAALLLQTIVKLHKTNPHFKYSKCAFPRLYLKNGGAKGLTNRMCIHHEQQQQVREACKVLTPTTELLVAAPCHKIAARCPKDGKRALAKNSCGTLPHFVHHPGSSAPHSTRVNCGRPLSNEPQD